MKQSIYDIIIAHKQFKETRKTRLYYCEIMDGLRIDLRAEIMRQVEIMHKLSQYEVHSSWNTIVTLADLLTTYNELISTKGKFYSHKNFEIH